MIRSFSRSFCIIDIFLCLCFLRPLSSPNVKGYPDETLGMHSLTQLSSQFNIPQCWADEEHVKPDSLQDYSHLLFKMALKAILTRDKNRELSTVRSYGIFMASISHPTGLEGYAVIRYTLPPLPLPLPTATRPADTRGTRQKGSNKDESEFSYGKVNKCGGRCVWRLAALDSGGRLMPAAGTDGVGHRIRGPSSRAFCGL